MAKTVITAPTSKEQLLDISMGWPLAVAKAINSIGDTNYGNSSISPDANGNGTIEHGFTVAPSFISLEISGDNAYHVKVQSVDTSDITVLIIDSAGTDVTSGIYTIYWLAKI